jgi:hypothetical protein
VSPSKGTLLVEETSLERKRHSWLSLIVEVCCTSNNANQCPGRYMQDKEKEGSKHCIWRCMHFKMHVFLDASLPTGNLLLNSANLGRGMERTCTFHVSPSNFVSKNNFWNLLFCQEASANKPIQVKSALLSLFVLDWTQWGFLLPGCISFDSRECGVFGQCISLSPVCEPSHPSESQMGMLTNHLGSITTLYLVHR